MTNEELKGLWAQQAGSDQSIRISPETVWQLAQASERFERAIFWRNVREWLATAVVAGFFLFVAFVQSRVHWLLIAAAMSACIPMGFVAILDRRGRAPDSLHSLADHLRGSIASVQHQIRLLRSVLWWYLLPIALSMFLVTLDRLDRIRMHAGVGFFLLVAVSVAIFVGVWALNQRTVRKELEPRLRALKSRLDEFESAPTELENS